MVLLRLPQELFLLVSSFTKSRNLRPVSKYCNECLGSVNPEEFNELFEYVQKQIKILDDYNKKEISHIGYRTAISKKIFVAFIFKKNMLQKIYPEFIPCHVIPNIQRLHNETFFWQGRFYISLLVKDDSNVENNNNSVYYNRIYNNFLKMSSFEKKLLSIV